ncbi:CaiB/BaiF CoA-transferase family protein [Aquamicrobium sp. LC103]|uniref:CaiB/BaiF CoA transferase family protein n=1 Tax=Aquamicrobium sp. LC103 TaxID=1120658 RepID=UPI00063E8969|nr:CaiB/BaiF CoA-transferase family protein [Aquamicrobium sp. LC103]TKT74489.1 CoA transferase [Aquamicrobium sp. LC103]
MSDEAEGPLAGLRIVEFVGLGPAPFAAMLLADMGADIVRIDRPNASPIVPDKVTGRSRPTVTANLKNADDIEQVKALLAGADALIEGFRPGVMERLGLGPEPLLALNPRLVYGRMTGWGQEGPLASYAGHDINYIAVTGTLAAIGTAERAVPPLNLVGDYGGGALYLALGVLAGIISAARTGRGQIVDAAMVDGAASLMSLFVEMRCAGMWADRREANMLDGGASYYGVYRCADGLEVAVGAIEPQFHAELLRHLGFEAKDFTDRMDSAAFATLRGRLAERIATRPRAEWLAMLEHTDACFTPVVALGDAPKHPHLAARGTFVEHEGLTQPAPAPRFSRTPSRIFTERRVSLSLGEALERWSDQAILSGQAGGN